MRNAGWRDAGYARCALCGLRAPTCRCFQHQTHGPNTQPAPARRRGGARGRCTEIASTFRVFRQREMRASWRAMAAPPRQDRSGRPVMVRARQPLLRWVTAVRMGATAPIFAHTHPFAHPWPIPLPMVWPLVRPKQPHPTPLARLHRSSLLDITRRSAREATQGNGTER